MKTYSTYQSRIPDIINNSQGTNITWATEIVNDKIRYLVTKYYFNERSYDVPGGTVAQTQFYNLPPQVKKVINVTLTIGGVKWQPIECPTRVMWDKLNVITFYQDYPSHFFIYNGQLGIFPIPATSGNTLTINYKTRIPDLSMVDVSTGTMTATSGSTTITASASVFKHWMGNSGWIRLNHSTTDSTDGDEQWYQIDSLTSGTQAVLKNIYSGSNVTGATYTIGDVPILPEDYQDLPLYGMAYVYYTTRYLDPTKSQQYQKLWDDGVKALDEEFGSKTNSVVLQDVEAPLINPNLFQRQVS